MAFASRSSTAMLVAVLVAPPLGMYGCAGPGEYVWFQQLPPELAPSSGEYVIGLGDQLEIRVLGHEEMTLKERVRPDGRLSVPLIGDVEARGKRVSGLKAELEGRLKDYIVSPSVSVILSEPQPLTVLLFGEVTRPGAIPLDHDRRLAHALALAGGLTEYASRSSIFVVRSSPKPIRIRFTFESIYRDIDKAGDFQLQPGDIVEVE
jgi:polysaccharide biosynthesis/export protein